MFSSPCILRSTHCAALIAFAAAAGIVRVPEAAPPPRATATEHRAEVATRSFDASRFTIPERIAPWLQAPDRTLGEETSRSVDTSEHQAADVAATDLPIPPRRQISTAPTRSCVRAIVDSQHRLPFAVGPPAAVFNCSDSV